MQIAAKDVIGAFRIENVPFAFPFAFPPLFFLRPVSRPHKTPDMLPVAGQALPGAIGYPQGSYERFPRCFLHLLLLSPSFAWRKECPFCISEVS
jgi:hypothetical protein